MTRPSYYTLQDDFLRGDAPGLRAGCLLETRWGSYGPGGLHTIELRGGRVVARYVRRVVQSRGEPALEIHGGDSQERELLPLRLVRRVGRARALLQPGRVRAVILPQPKRRGR